MHSPLPDSSALEAGIILEDDRPTRISRVQDNVRNLLRASVFSSIRGSTLGSPSTHSAPPDGEGEALPRRSAHVHIAAEPEVLPSPTSATSTSPTETEQQHDVPGVLFPPTTRYTQERTEAIVAHQSSLYNTRAVAALDHPDLTDPSLAVFLQAKTERRQRRAWKRSRNRKIRYASARGGASQWLLCFIPGLLLVAIVGTYVILATTSSDVSTTFHVLFVLGILLATVLFAHTLIRICLRRGAVPASPTVYVVSDVRGKRRHRRRGEHHIQHHQRQHQDSHPRHQPTLSESSADFMPPTPIPVHVASDEVRPDSREAQPSAAVEPMPAAWDKDLNDLPNPPPAYGRWRGSVRADPDLLHWQAVPSPIDLDTPGLPSPTYEEAVHQSRTGPPSYMTRDSPARRRDVQEGPPLGLVQAQAAEPEMVEVRGVGFAV